MNDLSIITVTHESASFIEEQVFSVIHGALTCSIQHIVIDNASKDNTSQILDQLPLSKVIKNKENVGFAIANNQGLQHATGRYVLFLNPDMRVQEESLDELVMWMDAHPEVGIASCLLRDAHGFILPGNPRKLPNLWREMRWLLGGQNSYIEAYNVSREVEMVKGAFMFVRREVLQKLGWAFDPRYFLLFEDADLCQEVRRLGYKIVFHPHIYCIDFNSRSFATKPSRWVYACYAKSMQRYFHKWGGWYQGILIAFFAKLGSLLRQ